jgi:hypothetical protein
MSLDSETRRVENREYLERCALRASELVKLLEEAMEQHGDCKVVGAMDQDVVTGLDVILPDGKDASDGGVSVYGWLARGSEKPVIYLY